MAVRLAQIGAMTYYEMRMLWRQRVLPTFVLSMIVMVSITLIAWKSMTATALPGGVAADSTLTQLANLAAFAGMFWPMVYVLILMLGSLAVADVIPRDRQLGVNALIDSTPLSRATYLIGKLCGVWAALLLGLAVAMAVVGVMGRWLVGVYDIGLYVRMWLGGIAPIGILYVGLGLLLTVPFASRRYATLFSLAYGLTCVLLMPFGLMSDATIWGLLNPARPYVYNYYWLGWLGGGFIVSTDYAAAQWSIVVGIIELLGVGALAWLWLRLRDHRE